MLHIHLFTKSGVEFRKGSEGYLQVEGFDDGTQPPGMRRSLSEHVFGDESNLAHRNSFPFY